MGAGRDRCGNRHGVEAPPGEWAVERQGPGKAGMGGAAGMGPRQEKGVPTRRGLEGQAVLSGGAPQGGKGSREVESKGQEQEALRGGCPTMKKER